MKKIDESQKVTLTLGQLKRLVRESISREGDFDIEDGTILKRFYGGSIERDGNVVIPDGVKTIWHDAFHHHNNISSVTIPDSVTSIKTWAFSYCEFLENVKIGNGVTEILDCAFSHCPRLTSVTIGNNVQIIGNNAFEKCIKLPSITIPASVNEIGQYAFYGCRRLKEIHVANQAQKDMILDGKNNLPRTTRIIVDGEDSDDGYEVTENESGTVFVNNRIDELMDELNGEFGE